MNRTNIKLLSGSGLFLGFCYLLSLMPTYTEHGPVFAVFTHVPFGWWHFLKRNLSEVTVNWNTIASGIIYSVLILISAHWVIGTMFKQVQTSKDPGGGVRIWPWRWTICAYATLWLLFAIAFAAVGIFTHTTWLAEYRGPWYEEQTGHPFELHIARSAIDASGGYDPATLRKAILSERSLLPSRDLFLEQYDVVSYKNKDGNITALLIIPRRPQPADRGMFYLECDSERTLKPLSELQKSIAELDTKYSVTQ